MLKVSSKLFSVVCLLLLLGCASDEFKDTKPIVGWTKMFDQYELERSSRWNIDQNVNLYLVFPPEEYMDEALHEHITGIFQRYYPKTRAGLYREALPQSFVSAKRGKMDFVVYPRVLARKTPVNVAKFLKKEADLFDVSRAQLDVDILIYATSGEKLIDQLQFTSKGGMTTLDETSMMWKPLDAYLQQISQYGVGRL